ncbi:methyltransferase domain-containing protein [Micromonospora radicis]|uniref:Methyltransferase domain-containing protein n=2 Tax=Micromonospora radicis TaxID=1894971 RepID=A0A418MZZ8_9ACTN|nr:methyltransferase domain-containing protein [Micromonospora radicis]
MLLSPAGVEALRTALTRTNFTAAGIAARLGPQATAAVARNDFRAALRATTDGDPLATLIRVFICEQTEPEPAVAAALAPLPIADALDAGLVERYRDGVRMGLDLEPYGDDWWVLADVPASARPGRSLHAEHVLGIGGATQTMIGAAVRRPVERALDLGTGSGVQALHLSTHARQVTATDVSPRALRFAATTAALNGQDWELLRGDMVAPVAGRRFDLVVSNPPFVVGPGATTHVYRDSGRVGDAISAELAAAAPGLLTEGGTMQYLANWVHVSGEDWGERVAGWFAGTGLDAWVVQREVADPMSYVDLWLTDVGEADPQRMADWLDWFDAHKVEAIGFGIVSLRRGGHDDPVLRVEDLRQRVEAPLGDRIATWFDRHDWLREQGTEGVLAARYRATDGLRLHQEATIGPEGWGVDRQVLTMPHGLRWTEEIDPLVLALVGGADGRLPLRDQLALLAAAHDVTVDELAEAAGPIVAHLVERGFVEPVRP